MKDYYAVLEITENASEEVIKAAYKALVKKYHPDNNPDEKMAEKMKEVNEAFDVLSNPEKRAKYDLSYRGNHAEKEDEAESHFYDASDQPKRNIKRMEPLDSDRLKVQGIKYCGGTLWESDEVSVYMNFRYKLEVLKARFKNDGDKLNFSVDKDNYKLLMTIYDNYLERIKEAFYVACDQMGMYEDEADCIYNDVMEFQATFMGNPLVTYQDKYKEILQSGKMSYKWKSGSIRLSQIWKRWDAVILIMVTYPARKMGSLILRQRLTMRCPKSAAGMDCRI